MNRLVFSERERGYMSSSVRLPFVCL